MASMIEWYGSNESIPQSDITLFALPGVGDVGKTAIENIKESMECELIARVLNSGFPPHATLDSDGLITPPHIEISLSRSNSKSILLITGEHQPLNPPEQFELTQFILSRLEKKTEELLVLVGMASEPTRKEVFLVPSSSEYRLDLEGMGVDVRRDEPKAGAIGMAALMASMGPVYGIRSALSIATTIGSSKDSFATDRLLHKLSEWWSLDLLWDDSTESSLIAKLHERSNGSRQDLVSDLTNTHDASYM